MNESYNVLKDTLIATIFRLHPITKPIKDEVKERIIAQVLYKNTLSINEIQKLLLDRFNLHFSISEIKNILSNSQNFEYYNGDYSLSKKYVEMLIHHENENKSRYERVIHSLFKDEKNIKQYEQPFFDFLGRIFTKIAEEYVMLLKGEIESMDVIGKNYFNEMIENTAKSYEEIDIHTFKRGIKKFFTYPDPDYDFIKWTTAQSYYLLKVLGLDPAGHLLTEEKFKNAIFYLDTNILIAYFFSEHVHNKSVEYFLRTVIKLNGTMKITQITKDEFNSWINYKLSVIENTHSVIPEEIELNDFFFLEFKKYIKESKQSTNLIDGFKKYLDGRIYSEIGKFELVDDPWFLNYNDGSIKKLVYSLKRRYLTVRGGKKSDAAALHDALLLLWIDKERIESNNSKIWLITLDTSLPSILYKGENTISITLDTFLQWVSPFINDFSMVEIFSLLLRNRFFPPEKIFDLKDFLIFSELEIKTKDLPPEDVEESILYLKRKFGEIDLSSSKSLSKISYELARFFADPSRKYQQEIRKAYEEQEEIKNYYEEKLGKLNEQMAQIKSDYEKRLKEKDEDLQNVKKRLSTLEKEREIEKLKRSAQKKLLITFLFTIFIESIVVFIINIYGAGNNLFQKLTNSWPWLTLGVPVFIVSGWFIIGKKRLTILGWPFDKLFKTKIS